MAKEYIEREAALKFLENSLTFSEIELDIGEYRKGCIAAIQDDIGNIKNMPAADVVPKSDIVGEIFGEIEKYYCVNKFGEVYVHFDSIEEIKKKYKGEV